MNNFYTFSHNTHIKKGVFMEKSVVKKRVNPATIAIIILSILLLVSITVGVTLAYFQANRDVTGTITLGNPVNINITQGGASVTSLTFSDTAMPGTTYDQVIGVSIPADTSNSLLRAKLTLTDTEGATTIISATTDASWTKGDDDYYYYNGVASANQSIDFVTAITVPTSLTNDVAKKVLTVNVVVEAIQEANYAAASVWTTAPSDWIATYATAPST